jgi:hypothetical protein
MPTTLTSSNHEHPIKGNSTAPMRSRDEEDVDHEWEGMGQIATKSALGVDLPPTDRVVDEGTLAVWALLDAAGRRDDRAGHVKVRFIEPSNDREVWLLEVEQSGAPSNGEDLRQALFRLRLQVVGPPKGTVGGSVERLHVVEFDGATIGKRRRLELCEDLAVMLGDLAPHERVMPSG